MSNLHAADIVYTCQLFPLGGYHLGNVLLYVQRRLLTKLTVQYF